MGTGAEGVRPRLWLCSSNPISGKHQRTGRAAKFSPGVLLNHSRTANMVDPSVLLASYHDTNRRKPSVLLNDYQRIRWAYHSALNHNTESASCSKNQIVTGVLLKHLGPSPPANPTSYSGHGPVALTGGFTLAGQVHRPLHIITSITSRMGRLVHPLPQHKRSVRWDLGSGGLPAHTRRGAFAEFDYGDCKGGGGIADGLGTVGNCQLGPGKVSRVRGRGVDGCSAAPSTST